MWRKAFDLAYNDIAGEKRDKMWYIRRVCPVCGKEFEISGQKKYCSVECRKVAYAARYTAKSPEKRVCPICGKEFEANGQKKYCCKKCARKADKDWRKVRGCDIDPLKSRVCPVCGKIFEQGRSNQKYCSPECYRKVDHARYTATLPKIRVCSVCGKEFEANTDQKYCSPECRRKAYRNARKMRTQEKSSLDQI